MTTIQVIQWPDSRLKQAVSPLDLSSADLDEVSEKLEQMIRLMHEGNGVGLAATQVGWMTRAFVMRFVEEHDGEQFERNRCLLNPSMSTNPEASEVTDFEGCLSAVLAPQIPVVRWSAVDLQWQEIVDGEVVEMSETFTGLNARVAQHEIDHLDGRMYWDNVNSSFRKRALKAYPPESSMSAGPTKEEVMAKRRKKKRGK